MNELSSRTLASAALGRIVDTNADSVRTALEALIRDPEKLDDYRAKLDASSRNAPPVSAIPGIDWDGIRRDVFRHGLKAPVIDERILFRLARDTDALAELQLDAFSSDDPASYWYEDIATSEVPTLNDNGDEGPSFSVSVSHTTAPVSSAILHFPGVEPPELSLLVLEPDCPMQVTAKPFHLVPQFQPDVMPTNSSILVVKWSWPCVLARTDQQGQLTGPGHRSDIGPYHRRPVNLPWTASAADFIDLEQYEIAEYYSKFMTSQYDTGLHSASTEDVTRPACSRADRTRWRLAGRLIYHLGRSLGWHLPMSRGAISLDGWRSFLEDEMPCLAQGDCDTKPSDPLAWLNLVVDVVAESSCCRADRRGRHPTRCERDSRVSGRMRSQGEFSLAEFLASVESEALVQAGPRTQDLAVLRRR